MNTKLSICFSTYYGTDIDKFIKIVKLMLLYDNNFSLWDDNERLINLYECLLLHPDKDKMSDKNKMLESNLDHVERHLINENILNNIELIIVIDEHCDDIDFSDETNRIVNELTELMNKIQFDNYRICISHEPIYLSTSRNLGKIISHGDYILFADDDDFHINIQCIYETLMNHAQENEYKLLKIPVLYNRQGRGKYITLHANVSTWSRIYKRDTFICPFPISTKRFYGEDWLFNTIDVINFDKVGMIFKPLILYAESGTCNKKDDDDLSYLCYVPAVLHEYRHIVRPSHYILMLMSHIINSTYYFVTFKDVNNIGECAKMFAAYILSMYNDWNNLYKYMFNESLPDIRTLDVNLNDYIIFSINMYYNIPRDKLNVFVNMTINFIKNSNFEFEPSDKLNNYDNVLIKDVVKNYTSSIRFYFTNISKNNNSIDLITITL